ncbi:MAG: undecaprenyl-diphosphate phosphatase [Candidatus Bipolaricaulota bacterium]|nr:undecaprenyl-diphosphate phosphatase [Candidatus Bipolaricaulota bacterium]MCX7844291.1 undecaprenyl-diphosphate phosphatase [Candidatus Bipolaricaulota bacterium]MDW8151912.1 undecaprenyl-diphosphate phosphatase [Candidatus Bipolaricaulota bacterium]
MGGAWARYLWLGLVQGLTEFLPVSSSAHLLLAQRALGLREPGPLLVAAAHLGTLLALLFWFRRDLASLARGLARGDRAAGRYALALGLGTLPLVAGAGLARGRLDQILRAELVPYLLLANGLVLLGSRLGKRPPRARALTPRTALLVGLAQLLAVLPGLSRSGLTLSAGLALGLGREEAFRFALLLGIPAVVGGAALAAWEGAGQVGSWAGLALVLGTAFAAGLLALAGLARALRRGALWPFGLYCLLLAALALALG